MAGLMTRPLVTSAGITFRRGHDERGHILRFEGRALTSDLMESLMLEIARCWKNRFRRETRLTCFLILALIMT